MIDLHDIVGTLNLIVNTVRLWREKDRSPPAPKPKAPKKPVKKGKP
jgi:hypothetical protein